jgi:hydrogenase expression/formation protein HypC
VCLALPGKVLEVAAAGEGTASIDVRGAVRTVDIAPLPDLRPGEWVLVSLGMAVDRISEADALETLRLLDEIEAAGAGR